MNRSSPATLTPSAVVGLVMVMSSLAACPGSSTNEQGTWIGSVAAGTNTAAIEFDLNDSSTGAITGTLKIPDPVTGALISMGTVTGTLADSHATWVSIGGLQVEGDFSGDKFTGTAVYPAVSASLPALSTTLTLARSK